MNHSLITIIEDDESQRKFFKKHLLKRFGELNESIDILTISSISEVAQTFNKKKETKVYIVDINLGIRKDEEGIEIIKLIKSQSPNAFIIAYSAYTDKKQKCIDAGASFFMKKSATNYEEVLRQIVSIVKSNAIVNSQSLETKKRDNGLIIDYYNDLEAQGRDYLYEVKLLIIGEAGAGKTTLAHRLVKPQNGQISHEVEFHTGIQIRKLKFKTDRGHNFTVNIWDFSEEEILYAIHQIFLTDHSLYILVDDASKGSEISDKITFSYWLQTVNSIGSNSPLLIVQNQKNDKSKDINFAALQGQFGFIKEKFSVNLETNKEGLKKVFNAIKYYAPQLPQVGEILPKNWFTIRQQLEVQSIEKPYINFQEFLDICSKNEIKEKEKALRLSTHLHNLGALLHFQKNIALKNLIILRNEWVTNAVSKLLQSDSIKNAKGQFIDRDLNNIWNDVTYNYKHGELLALMKEFELCYELENKENAYIAPQLLPKEVPDHYTWDKTENIQLRYQYDFIPKGLFSKFIVRIHHFIKDTSQLWKYGTILVDADGDTIAEVIEILYRNEITIKVRGTDPKGFLAILKNELDRLNKSYKNLKVKTLVPCNCITCNKDNTEPYFYQYNKLKERLKNDTKTIECQQYPYENVNVNSLINVSLTSEKINPAKKDTTLQIFISYAHEDINYKKQLDTSLVPLKRSGKINIWDDTQILPGNKWSDKIFSKLNKADIILALLSPDFIASDFCMTKEMEVAFDKHNKGETRIIPIIIRPCVLENTDFSKIQCIPAKSKSIATSENKDSAWVKVVHEIKKVIGNN